MEHNYVAKKIHHENRLEWQVTGSAVFLLLLIETLYRGTWSTTFPMEVYVWAAFLTLCSFAIYIAKVATRPMPNFEGQMVGHFGLQNQHIKEIAFSGLIDGYDTSNHSDPRKALNKNTNQSHARSKLFGLGIINSQFKLKLLVPISLIMGSLFSIAIGNQEWGQLKGGAL